MVNSADQSLNNSPIRGLIQSFVQTLTCTVLTKVLVVTENSYYPLIIIKQHPTEVCTKWTKILLHLSLLWLGSPVLQYTSLKAPMTWWLLKCTHWPCDLTKEHRNPGHKPFSCCIGSVTTSRILSSNSNKCPNPHEHFTLLAAVTDQWIPLELKVLH